MTPGPSLSPAPAAGPADGVRRIRPAELLTLLSLTMAMSALAIDMMLPAFGEMRAAFGMAPDSPEVSATVTAFFVGLAAAQILYGPFSDRFGRRPVLFAGIGLFTLGAAGSALAPTFGLLLAGRVLWGLGAAGPRVIVLAIVRDTYQGDRMARAMSLMMAVFILVPVAAPNLGAALLHFLPWTSIFWFCAVYAAGIALWAMARLPETLDPSHRIPLQFHRVRRAASRVVTERAAMGYAAAMMILFALFSSYLGSTQLIIDDVFGLDARFPLIFGAMAAVMGATTLANAAVVERIGARRMVRAASTAYVVFSALLVALAAATGGLPSFWAFIVLLTLVLAMNALLTPNLSTLAMNPMGEVAGTASALIGTAQIGGGALLGSIVDRLYDGSVAPLSVGFLSAGALAWLLIRGAGRRH
jgi:DHA1 family bicyclomycin/chloramphenicol resistance-like MFS transporter